MHCNSYKSHTDARFRFFGAPGRFRGSFPDIHNAKVEVATPESFGDAVKAQFEFKPLQPIATSKSRFSLDVGDLLGIKGAPTLVVSARDDGFGTYAAAEYTAGRIAAACFR